MTKQTSVAAQYARGLEIQLKGLLLIPEIETDKKLKHAVNRLARKVRAHGDQAEKVATGYAAAATGKGKANPLSSYILKAEGKSIIADAEELVERLKEKASPKAQRKSTEVPVWLTIAERLYDAVQGARTGEDGEGKEFEIGSLKGLVEDKELIESVSTLIGGNPMEFVSGIAGEILPALMLGGSDKSPVDLIAEIVAKKLVGGVTDFASGKIEGYITRKSNEHLAKSVAAIADSIVDQANTLTKLAEIASSVSSIAMIHGEFKGKKYDEYKGQLVDQVAPLVADGIKSLLDATGAGAKIESLLSGIMGGGGSDEEPSSEAASEEPSTLTLTVEPTDATPAEEPSAAVEPTEPQS